MKSVQDVLNTLDDELCQYDDTYCRDDWDEGYFEAMHRFYHMLKEAVDIPQ